MYSKFSQYSKTMDENNHDAAVLNAYLLADRWKLVEGTGWDAVYQRENGEMQKESLAKIAHSATYLGFKTGAAHPDEARWQNIPKPSLEDEGLELKMTMGVAMGWGWRKRVANEAETQTSGTNGAVHTAAPR
ncbi:hypothetical protein CMO91_01595 [Candidatus Woesearchaeota archaeon]|nr:hypothetical protein [Candidatus Woesearchaeota archaeon]